MGETGFTPITTVNKGERNGLCVPHPLDIIPTAHEMGIMTPNSHIWEPKLGFK